MEAATVIDRALPIWPNGNWRMIFGFEGENALLSDYLDYHQQTVGFSVSIACKLLIINNIFLSAGLQAYIWLGNIIVMVVRTDCGTSFCQRCPVQVLNQLDANMDGVSLKFHP